MRWPAHWRWSARRLVVEACLRAGRWLSGRRRLSGWRRRRRWLMHRSHAPAKAASDRGSTTPTPQRVPTVRAEVVVTISTRSARFLFLPQHFNLVRVGGLQLLHILNEVELLGLGEVLEVVEQGPQLFYGQIVKLVEVVISTTGGGATINISSIVSGIRRTITGKRPFCRRWRPLPLVVEVARVPAICAT